MSGRDGKWVTPCSNPTGRAVGLHLAVRGSLMVLVAPPGEVAVLDAEQARRFELGVAAACAAVAASAAAEAVDGTDGSRTAWLAGMAAAPPPAAAGCPASHAAVVGPSEGAAPPQPADGGIRDE